MQHAARFHHIRRAAQNVQLQRGERFDALPCAIADLGLVPYDTEPRTGRIAQHAVKPLFETLRDRLHRIAHARLDAGDAERLCTAGNRFAFLRIEVAGQQVSAVLHHLRHREALAAGRGADIGDRLARSCSQCPAAIL